MSFSLVEFKTDHSLMTVPSRWIFENKKYCHFPPAKKSKIQITSAIKESVMPSVEWQKFKIKIHFEGSFENCEEKLKEVNDKPVSDSSSEITDEYDNTSTENVDASLSLDETLINQPADDLKSVLKNQKLILRELYALRNQIQDIPKECKCSSTPPLMISKKYILPINDIEELKNLDKTLGENPEEKKIFVRNMVQVGGKNVQVCTYRILEKLLTAEISMEMNWCGKNPNKFAIINLKNLVICIVQSVCLTVKCKEDEVETYIKNYLRTAKDRLRLRSKQPNKVGRSSIDYGSSSCYEELLKDVDMPTSEN